MSKSNGTGQPQWVPPNPDFSKVCSLYNHLYYDTLVAIAEQAGVSKEVIEAMYIGNPVKHSEAVAVLKAFSQQVGDSWTLENTSVPTISEESEDQP